jgi:hypothetical protein
MVKKGSRIFARRNSMIIVNGSCSDCGHAVGPSEKGAHQANHDRTRIESDPQHLIETCEIQKAVDERTPLTAVDIEFRGRLK